LIWDFWIPNKIWENIFLVLKPPSLW
jgi:hypothetical protein